MELMYIIAALVFVFVFRKPLSKLIGITCNEVDFQEEVHSYSIEERRAELIENLNRKQAKAPKK
jgi:hypothetical protein